MFKGRINEKSISAKIEKAMLEMEGEVKRRLVGIAEDLVTRTPVDTGAYAESFSVVPAGSGSGRMKTSRGRPRNQDLGTYRGIALQNMTADIEGLQLQANRSVSFKNRAPHAGKVESLYHVFGAVKDINR